MLKNFLNTLYISINSATVYFLVNYSQEILPVCGTALMGRPTGGCCSIDAFKLPVLHVTSYVSHNNCTKSVFYISF